MGFRFIFSCFYFYASLLYFFFFFNDTATTEIYTLSLHDALPILVGLAGLVAVLDALVRPLLTLARARWLGLLLALLRDRKSTRLNSSHANISYAVFCLKKKKKKTTSINKLQCTYDDITQFIKNKL